MVYWLVLNSINARRLGLADQDFLNRWFVLRQFQHHGGACFGEFGEAVVPEVAEADVQIRPFDQNLAAENSS